MLNETNYESQPASDLNKKKCIAFNKNKRTCYSCAYNEERFIVLVAQTSSLSTSSTGQEALSTTVLSQVPQQSGYL